MPKTKETPTNEPSADSTPTSAPTLDQKVAVLTTEITVMTARATGLEVAINGLKESTPDAKDAIEGLQKEHANVCTKIEAKRKQLENLTADQRYAAVFEPFFADLSAIAIPSELRGATLPATLDMDQIDARLKAANYAVLVLSTIKTSAEAHLSGEKIDQETWDNMRPLHVIESEDKSTVTVKFAERKRAASSGSGEGSGRGHAAVWKITSVPDGYTGPASVGDTFGPGTQNPEGKAFAQTIAPDGVGLEKSYDGLVASREGRISPSNALKGLGFKLEQVAA